MKICTKCNVEKHITDFYRDLNRMDGHQTRCKSCSNELRKEYYRKNREIEIGRSIDWNRKNKIKYKLNHSRYVESNTPYRFSVMKAHAKRRGIIFDMSFEEYLPLTLLCCHYCGGELPRRGGGLDRIDSNKGYSIENVVPCCQLCNQGKMNQTQSEFIDRCVRIAEKYKKETINQIRR